MPNDDPITVNGLTKRYRGHTVVDDLTFAVRAGAVTGFFGRNGAGKTTTLRMLLGLSTPTAGTALVGGTPYHQLPRPARAVGAVLHADGFHPGRRAVDHLRLVAMMAGVPPERAMPLIHAVGLADAARQRVGTFSLGMRQRLAIATALVGDPPVLVLDEPTNGLDPDGVHWLRNLLRTRVDAGAAVLVSSHLLAEMARLVDDVVIVHHGRLVLRGAVQDLGDDLESAFLALTGGATP